jgi:prepilin-type N-terminal cleavage/methylation domain-containing protein
MIRLTTTTPVAARRRRAEPAGMASGFTLVELLVVIVVLSILIALLLPAINSAVKTARNAAVSAEINQLAQALESFKSKYGDYPPSRVLLVENGNYSTYIGNTNLLSSIDKTAGSDDINIGQLATRTLTAFRKFWPRVQLSTSGLPTPVVNGNGNYWYDFNGNGTMDGAYILHGHECLVFFLGGVPLFDSSSQGYGMTGFGKDPTNPFTNSIVPTTAQASPMYNANRQPPYFEFNAGRLYLDPSNLTTPGIPGYYDTLGSQPPPVAETGTTPPAIGTGSGPVNFYAYFCANGSGNYDPNDVNFYENDVNLVGPLTLQYTVGFATNSGTTPYAAISPSPNPYTSTATVTTSGTITYQKPQTFQVISSGIDGLYGVGGQYQAATTSATVPLPVDATHTIPNNDGSIRQREYDNLTNFKTGTLD